MPCTLMHLCEALQQLMLVSTLFIPSDTKIAWTHFFGMSHPHLKKVMQTLVSKRVRKRKDYTFRRRFNEKPGIILGCQDPIGS